MMGGITIGQYFPGVSPVHRLDPRAKIVLTLSLIAAVFLAKDAVGYALLFAFVIGSALIARVNPKLLIKGMKPVLVIIALTFFLNLFFTASGEVIFQWKWITVTDGGLRAALFMALRLTLLITGTQLLTLTTSPIALTDGLEMLFSPLKRVGFPAHELAMMMSIALRFIPTLLEETDKIRKAQMARGADFESGGLVSRAKAMLPLLVPLFVSAFRRADELALAMEARCYRGGDHRTRMKVLAFHWVDLWATLIMAALIALVVLL